MPEIRIPPQPSMPPEAFALLSDRLKTVGCYLEFGAGGSTVWAASLGVPTIVSVESDKPFLDAVRVSVDGTGYVGNLHAFDVDIGPTREWGFPVDNSHVANWPRYAVDIWHWLRAQDMSPELVLIDGRFRVACFLVSLMCAKPGTIILVDDFIERQHIYGTITDYLTPLSFADRMAEFRVPAHVDVTRIALDLARYVADPQ